MRLYYHCLFENILPQTETSETFQNSISCHPNKDDHTRLIVDTRQTENLFSRQIAVCLIEVNVMAVS